MKRIKIVVAIVAVLVLSGAASAANTLLKLTLSGPIDSQYDYPSGTYEPLSVPSSITITAWTLLKPFTIQDFGDTTHVTYPIGKAGLDHPLAPYVGADPFGNGLGDLGKSAYAFGNAQDYDSGFYEELAIQDNISHHDSTEQWTYLVDVRIRLVSPPRNADGSSDYPLTPGPLVTFLDGRVGQLTATYTALWSQFEIGPGGIPVYSGGKVWESRNMTLLSYELIPVQGVPEPASWLLMIAGMGAVGAAMRSRTGVRNIVEACH